jgi:hypothetical protein
MMEFSGVPYGMGGGSLLSILAATVTYYGPEGPANIPIYRATLVIYPLITLALCWLASHLVRIRNRWRPTWGDLGFALAMVAAAFAALATRWWWLVTPPAPMG